MGGGGQGNSAPAPGPAQACHVCGVSDCTKDFMDLRRLMACLNCRLDIAMGGNWTGHGRRAILSLVSKHGRQKIAAEYKRLRELDERKGAPGFRRERR